MCGGCENHMEEKKTVIMFDEDYKTSEQKDSIFRALVSIVPYAGSAIYEAAVMIKPPLHKKRLEEWYTKISQDIIELKEKMNIDPESLHSSEEFNSLIMKSSLLVIQNHQQEKLSCFKNIIINVLKGTPHDFDTQIIYLTLVDDLSVAHLNVLIYLNDPEYWYSMHNHSIPLNSNGIIALIMNAFNKSITSKEFALRMLVDLQNQGLIKHFNPGLIIKSNNYIKSYTTPWGRDFIRFISQYEDSI
jgi:hypothetical protein